MKERRSIVEQWGKGNASALVTLVRTEGSSYRRPGARLLVHENGTSVGAISGGCLEAEIARRAHWTIRNGATIERISTAFDDTAEIPYGLGCGGTLDLLVEPTDTPEAIALLEAMRDSLNSSRRNVVTWLPNATKPLRRIIYDDVGRVLFASSEERADDDVFDEWLEPPQRVFIFGAGDDAQPMTKLAALLGWRITVIDRRSQLARRERFPEADEVLVLDALTDSMISREDAVILMTHSYEQDRAWLTALLPNQPQYLGILGSRHRSSLLVSEAAAARGWTLDRACQNLFAPVGLDLGGDGAEAIALSTIAEIHACCEGKLGHSRRMTPATILEQVALGGSSRYLQCAL
jgi:xanthine/CO dehydrogenase XdhC/CoxF family maturation factor